MSGSVTDMNQFETELLQWASTSPQFSHPFQMRTYNISGTPIYRFHAEMTIPGTDLKVLGSGSDRSKVSAASKAIGEAIERCVVKEFQFKACASWFDISFSDASGSETTAIATNTAPPLPPRGLGTSNGWAVHFTPEQAIQNAAKEALERHVLMYSFLKDGWNGFDARLSGTYQDRKLYSIFAKYHFAGTGAGIAALDGKLFPGVAMGYLCADYRELATSERWGHALFEAIEGAIYHDQAVPNAEWVDKYGYGIIADYQRHYIARSLPFMVNESINAPVYASGASSLKAHLQLIDVGQIMGLPVPMFAAQVFGGDMIPLAFQQTFADPEVKKYVESSLQRWDLPLEMPEYHPVI